MSGAIQGYWSLLRRRSEPNACTPHFPDGDARVSSAHTIKGKQQRQTREGPRERTARRDVLPVTRSRRLRPAAETGGTEAVNNASGQFTTG